MKDTSKLESSLSPFEFSPTFKDELSAFKKVNQIGKKLSHDGVYIMYAGLLFGRNITNDGTANSVSIVIMSPKHINALAPLMPYPCVISGNDFYTLYNTGDFINCKRFANRIEIYFDVEETITEEFDIEKFCLYARDKGYSDFDVIVAYKKGWETNMEIYNLYLRYISTLKTITQKVPKPCVIRFTNFNNPILKKVLPIIEEVKSGTTIGYKDFDDLEFGQFMDREVPTEITIDDQTVRIMKNNFLTLSSSANISLKLIDVGQMYNFLMTITEIDNMYVCNFFKYFSL